MGESNKQAAELTVLSRGTYGAKRASLVAVLRGAESIRSMEDLAEEAGEYENAELTKALEGGGPLWLARGYESDEAVILSSEPERLAEGPSDARDFTYGTPVIEPAGHELLIFALDH